MTAVIALEWKSSVVKNESFQYGKGTPLLNTSSLKNMKYS